MSELNIPESWAETRLEVAGSWGSGGTPLKSKKDFYGGNINWLKTGDLNNGIITEVPDKITKLGLEDIGGRLYPPQTVVMAMYGATIGKLGILDIEVATNQACACCTTHQDIYYKYLFYWLMNYRKKYIALGQGGAQPNISRSLIYEQPFAIPPRPEQERIVQKIESCFDKIDATEANLNKIETLLEKYRESLLAKAFRGELVPQDPNDEPASVLLGKIREERSQNAKGKKAEQDLAPITDDEKPFEIPTGWQWVRFEEIAENFDGKRVPIKSTERKTTKGTYPYYGASGIIDYVDDFIFEGEHLLISEDGANLLARTYPISFIANGKFWVNNHAHIVKALPLTSNKFLELYFESLDISRWVTGAAQPKFNQAKLNSVPIPLPPNEEQLRILTAINKKLTLFDSLKGKLKREMNLLPKVKEAILQKAFEGKLVEQIPSEGTGHELLAKILARKATTQETELNEKTKKTLKKAVSVKGNRNGKK